MRRRFLEALEASSYVILQGMSGIGKTALAARIAHRQKDEFDNRIDQGHVFSLSNAA